jgi:hypothetical protein
LEVKNIDLLEANLFHIQLTLLGSTASVEYKRSSIQRPA